MAALACEADIIVTRNLEDYQQAPMDTFTRLRRLKGEMLEQLIENLNDESESASVAYTSAQVLALLGKNENTKPAQRKRILKALADAVHSPNAQRGIYEMVGAGIGEDDPFRVEYQGRLNQAFFQALLEVSGVL